LKTHPDHSTAFDGLCAAIEVCGTQTESFVSVASIDEHKGRILLYNVCNLNQDSLPLILSESIQGGEGIHTSLSYHNGHLAASDECGDIFVYDLASSASVFRFNADFGGVKLIKFTNAGSLITLGNSNEGHFCVWDVRSHSHPVLHMGDNQSHLSSLMIRSEYELILGSSEGEVVQYDTRAHGLPIARQQALREDTRGNYTGFIILIVTVVYFSNGSVHPPRPL
jgi:WD40 repeat protein